MIGFNFLLILIIFNYIMNQNRYFNIEVYKKISTEVYNILKQWKEMIRKQTIKGRIICPDCAGEISTVNCNRCGNLGEIPHADWLDYLFGRVNV